MSTASTSAAAALSAATWRKSSVSGGGNECVEVTALVVGKS